MKEENRTIFKLISKNIFIISVIISFINMHLYSQNFTKITQNKEYGNISTLALGQDQMVFAVNSEQGLCAYRFDGSTYHQMAITKIGAGATDIAISQDGTIFIAKPGDGLYSFRYIDSNFTNIAYYSNKFSNGRSHRIAFGQNKLIYYSDGQNLKAFSDDGDNISFIAYTSLAISGVTSRVYIEDMTLGTDGTIFIAGGSYGVLAYKFDGNTFSQIAWLPNSDYVHDVTGIAVDTNNNLFVADWREGLFVYTFNGSDFIKKGLFNGAPRIVSIGSDNIIYTFDSYKLNAYKYENLKLSEIASIYENTTYTTYCRDIKIASNKRVFLAMEDFGIRTYSFDGLNFDRVINFNDGGYSYDTYVDKNNNVFLANDRAGLSAYKFENNELIHKASINDVYLAIGVTAREDSTVFLACGYYGMRIYKYNGDSFTNITNVNDGNWAETIVVTDSIVFLEDNSGGIYSYVFNGNTLLRTDQEDEVGQLATDLVLSPSNQLLLANSTDGLRIYEYSNYNIIGIGHIPGEIYCVATDTEGTMFLGGNQKLMAYSYNGSEYNLKTSLTRSFTPAFIESHRNGIIFTSELYGDFIAHRYDGHNISEVVKINEDIEPQDFSVSEDGYLFIAGGSKGMLVYKYDDNVSSITNPSLFSDSYKLLQNYPNPFNPSTTISYSLPQSGFVQLKVYDILGKEVASLVNKEQALGNYKIEFTAKNLSSGVYFYRIVSNNYSVTKKMVLLK